MRIFTFFVDFGPIWAPPVIKPDLAGNRKARFQRDWRWLKPQWLNMGGGLGEGGEIPETGPADLITRWGPDWSKIAQKSEYSRVFIAFFIKKL